MNWRTGGIGVFILALAALVAWQARCTRAVPVLAPGGYVMHAHGEAHEVSFREDGFFVRAVPGKGFSRGTWRQRGAVVEAKEQLAGGGEARSWALTLTSPTTGTLDDGTACTLEVRGRE